MSRPTSDAIAQLAHARRGIGSERTQESIAALRSLAARHPDWADALAALGEAELATVDLGNARRHLRRAAELGPNTPATWLALAQACLAHSGVEEARRAIDRALALEPGDPGARRVLGDILRAQGDPRAAVEALRDAAPRDPIAAASLAGALGALSRDDEALAVVRAALETPNLAREPRSHLLHQLGAIMDRRGEHDAAFNAVADANRLRGSRFDAGVFSAWVDEVISTWTAARLASLPRARVDSELPVFIVGMPRSGTSLVERMIAAHPLCRGLGERLAIPAAARELLMPSPGHPMLSRLQGLKVPTLDRVSRRELDAIAREAPGAARACDKMMQNFMHLGLIELLFPRARVVHCRRDPLDTCLSCFFQYFPGINNMAWSNDLATLGRYHRDYARLMDHWRGVLLLRTLPVDYERFVTDPEPEARRLIEFIGLEWDPACLADPGSRHAVVTASVEQVRRPISGGSVGRAARYAKHLQPLRQALGLSG